MDYRNTLVGVFLIVVGAGLFVICVNRTSADGLTGGFWAFCDIYLRIDRVIRTRFLCHQN